MNRVISYFLCLSLAVSPALSSDNQEFEYKKELFSMNPVPDEFVQPSLSDLYQEACKRKLMYDKLFEYVGKHGLDKQVLSMFSSVHEHNCESSEHMTPQVSTLVYLKVEVGSRRSLVSFYQDCLGHMINNPKSINLEVIQTLYNHAAHYVRTTLPIITKLSFDFLQGKYPRLFFYINNSTMQMHANLGPSGNEELDLYYGYVKKFVGVDPLKLNTVEIWRLTSYLGKNPNCVTCLPLIGFFNSIHFNLNIERSLLAICPDLKFNSSKLATVKGANDVKFAFAAIKDEIGVGFVTNVLNKKIDRSTKDFIRKYSTNSDLQKRFIDTIVDFKSKSAQTLFQSLFSQSVLTENTPEKVQSAQPSKQNNNGKGRKNNNAKNKKQPKKDNKSTKKVIVLKDDESEEELTDNIENISDKNSISSISTNTIADTVNDFIESHGTTASKATTVLSTASNSVEPIDHIVAAFTNDNDAINSSVATSPSIASTSTNSTQTIDSQATFSYKDILLRPTIEHEEATESNYSNVIQQINFAHYQTTMSYNQYVYKRNVSSRSISSYMIGNNEYKFNSIVSFDANFLMEIMKNAYIGKHKKEDRLPNVASCVLRVHYKNQNENELLTAEFNSQKKYLSGAKSFKQNALEFKNSHKIVTAYNDFINEEELISLKEKNANELRDNLKKIIHKKLNEKVSVGGWSANSLDSEALMLLDLVNAMPNYVAKLTNNWTKPIEIKGLAVGIQSYRDCCWRCRNLIQGFQWSSDSLLQQISALAPKEGMLTLSNDYASVVIVSGVIKPNSAANDFFPPAKVEETLVLGAVNSNDKSKHKFVAVSRKD